jgi:hypothetical protein
VGVSDVIAVVSAVIAALTLGVAALQYLDAKRRRKTEAERLAAQHERLRTAVSAAVVAANSADLIVQRAKADDVSIAELQNIARVLRGTLSTLASQLDHEQKELALRRDGNAFVSAGAATLGDSAAG